MSSKFRSVIVVDDDRKVLDHISSILNSSHHVLTTSDPHRALGWLQNDATVGAIVVEQDLRDASGMDLLHTAKQVRPEAKRILIADYANLMAIVEGIHAGAVQRTVSKPIKPGELAGVVGAAGK